MSFFSGAIDEAQDVGCRIPGGQLRQDFQPLPEIAPLRQLRDEETVSQTARRTSPGQTQLLCKFFSVFLYIFLKYRVRCQACSKVSSRKATSSQLFFFGHVLQHIKFTEHFFKLYGINLA